jgi:hypothetical protein
VVTEDQLDTAKNQAAEALRRASNFSIERFLEMEPFRQSADQDRLLKSLRKAGLPE